MPATLAGTGPDITLFASMIDTVNLATRNTLYDFSQFEDFEEQKEKFSKNSTNLYTFLDGCYGMPITESFYMMFYRKDIFDELGLTPPKTWDEVKKVANVLQRKNLSVGIPQGIQVGELIQNTMFECFLFQNNGSYYEGDNWYKSAFSSPESISAAKLYTEFYTKYGFPVAFDPYTRFRNGEMPLLISTYSFYNQLAIGAPEIRGTWEMVTIPGTVQPDNSINRAVSGFGTSAIMFNKTENKEDGWKFIKWFTDTNNQAQ